MPKSVTNGVSRLIRRVTKHTPYHRDDVKVLVYAVFDEIRAMMEENAARRLYFERLGSFDIVKTKPRRGFDFKTKKPIIIPSRYVPKFIYNREMVANIKKIPIKDE